MTVGSWTAWPAISQLRRLTAARMPLWCGRVCSWPSWPEAKWPWTSTGTATYGPGGSLGVIVIGFFVALLSTLRFWFLATVGTGGLVPAIAGACLFTVATAGFLSLGYRALRAAETPQAWRARRQAGPGPSPNLWRRLPAAGDSNPGDAADRDRLIDAYLGHVRRQVQKTSPG